ncbi:MAG: hypothetical protein J3K34DRAFT_179712 [Monoraphidium minutum]|nr:MAG: hypothetical protein J3K34DRAFT_179712 [Monoraphidium minutum]
MPLILYLCLIGFPGIILGRFGHLAAPSCATAALQQAALFASSDKEGWARGAAGLPALTAAPGPTPPLQRAGPEGAGAATADAGRGLAAGADSAAPGPLLAAALMRDPRERGQLPRTRGEAWRREPTVLRPAHYWPPL